MSSAARRPAPRANRPGAQPDRPLHCAGRKGWSAHSVSRRHPYARGSFLGNPVRSRASLACRLLCIARVRHHSWTCACRAVELLVVGQLRLQAIHTPGPHTRFYVPMRRRPRVDRRHAAYRGTGRTDLPSGDAGALYESLFESRADARSDIEGISSARIPGTLSLDHRQVVG